MYVCGGRRGSICVCEGRGGGRKQRLSTRQNQNHLPKSLRRNIATPTKLIAMTSDLYVEGSLEPRCKEPSKGSDEGGKDGQREGVELGRIEVDGHST